MNKVTNALTIGVFGIITTEFGIIGILPDISEHFDVSIDNAGLLVSLFALVVAVSGPFTTLMMSRLERKKVVQLTIIIFIVSNILSALSDSFEGLLFARILPAFLLPVYFSNGLVIATDSVNKEKAMQAVATVYGGLSIATVIGIPMTTYVADLYSWKVSFWITAAINMIALLGISYFVPSMHVNIKLSYGIQLKVLKKKILWLNILTVCLITTGAFSVYSYFADYLKKIFEMDSGQISLMLMVFGITGVFGNWSAGIALSKSINKAIMAYIISMVITFLVLQHIGENFLFQSVLIGIWGFFHMAGFVISQAWISSAAPEAPEFTNSLVVSTGNLGIALGAALGGFIIANFGIHQVLWGGLISFCFSLLLVMMNYKYFIICHRRQIKLLE